MRQFVWLIILIFSMWEASSPVCAQSQPAPTAVEQFASALVAAPDETARAALLAQQPEFVTKELWQALTRLGEKANLRGERRQSITIHRLAQQIAERLNDQQGVAAALSGIGLGYLELGDYALAGSSFEQSLAISTARQDRSGEAVALRNLGQLYWYQASYDEALNYWRKGLTIFTSLGDQKQMARMQSLIANVYVAQGNYDLALEQYQQALTQAEAFRDPRGIGVLLNNIGIIHGTRGNQRLAMEYYLRSLKIREANGDRPGMSAVLQNIGNLYYRQGNFDLALDYYRRGLAMDEAMENNFNIALSKFNIGRLFFDQGNFALAQDYYEQSLTMREALPDNDGIAQTLDSLGLLYQAQGQPERALDAFQRSLHKRDKELGDKDGVTETLTNLGRLHLAQGRTQMALEQAERAVVVATEIGSRERLAQAQTLACLAHRSLNNITQARQACDNAISNIESLRADIVGGEQSEEQFFEAHIDPYNEMVELLIAEKQSEVALDYAERAKARVLLDVIRSGRTNITKAMTEQEREQERKLNNHLSSLNAQITNEKERQQPDATRLTALKSQVRKAQSEREAFQTALYAAHPDLKIQRGQTLLFQMSDADGLIADGQTALLEYVVAPEKTFLFVITQTKTKTQSERTTQVFTLPIKEQELTGRISNFRRRMAEHDIDFHEAASGLYDLLLRPAGVLLKDKTNLVIVPDATLWELPFQALQPTNGHYLIERAAISYAPSLSVLRELKRTRRHQTPAGNGLFAIGNPANGIETAKSAQLAQRDEKLAPLPDAENEVKRLAQLYQLHDARGAQSSRVYIGAEAREDRVKAEAGKYRLLHFATHGILNDASPMYSHLVLAQGGAQNGEDGLLEAWEMMNLDLKADLVVLSACETARGRVGKGEGIIGMNWALFVAGCPTTIVSQWKVASGSTVELMLNFYRHLNAVGQRGQGAVTKAEALRQAALTLMHDGKHRHPFYWASFVVVGDGHGK